jgi:uncharacterized protein YegL
MATNIYNLIILDESGSMDIIKQETINGFNETVQTIRSVQKEIPEQHHFITLVAFNETGIKTVYNAKDAEEVHELTQKDYKPFSSTPLYDAIGVAVKALQMKVEDQKDYTVLVTIITDGQENSSKEYTEQTINAMIDQYMKNGWIFTYIGANHNVKEAASRISIRSTLEFTTTSDGTQIMNQVNNKSREKAYHKLFNKMGNFLNDEFFD